MITPTRWDDLFGPPTGLKRIRHVFVTGSIRGVDVCGNRDKVRKHNETQILVVL